MKYEVRCINLNDNNINSFIVYLKDKTIIYINKKYKKKYDVKS